MNVLMLVFSAKLLNAAAILLCTKMSSAFFESKLARTLYTSNAVSRIQVLASHLLGHEIID